MTALKAGVLTLVVLVVAAFFGFTKSNPFSDPYELNAVVRDAQNLKPGAPVRIAGVDVGKVTKIDAAAGDAARRRGHDAAGRRRPAGAPRRDARGAAADPAGGQLLRRPQAGLVLGRELRGRGHACRSPRRPAP